MADLRIPLLLQTPAAVRFISAEPLLGRVMLPRKVHLRHSVRGDFPIGHHLIAMSGYHTAVSNPHGALSIPMDGKDMLGVKPDEFEDCGIGLDWVIVGGESGAGARPMHPDWARSLRDQCKAAGVPFFFKQWGEWRPDSTPSGYRFNQKTSRFMRDDGRIVDWRGEGASKEPDHDPTRWRAIHPVGTKAAGCLLDGIEYHEFPEAHA